MTETTINLIVSSVMTLYLFPLMFNILLFTMIKFANDSSKTKDEYPYKKFIKLSFIPLFNILLELYLLYQILKESHKFVTDKKNRVFSMGILFIVIIPTIITAFVISIPFGLYMLIAISIIIFIIIKG